MQEVYACTFLHKPHPATAEQSRSANRIPVARAPGGMLHGKPRHRAESALAGLRRLEATRPSGPDTLGRVVRKPQAPARGMRVATPTGHRGAVRRSVRMRQVTNLPLHGSIPGPVSPPVRKPQAPARGIRIATPNGHRGAVTLRHPHAAGNKPAAPWKHSRPGVASRQEAPSASAGNTGRLAPRPEECDPAHVLRPAQQPPVLPNTSLAVGFRRFWPRYLLL